MRFDTNSASTRAFVTLARELNNQLTEMMKTETETETEWVVEDTKIKVFEWGH